MALNWTITQFYNWVDSLFTDNTNREINEADIRDGLKITAEYANDMKLAAEAVNANFVARSLNLNATVYIRADTGNDSRTGENDGSTATGAVLTLDRAIALQSGKTQNLQIVLVSGTLNLTAAKYDIYAEQIRFQVMAGATLAFRKRTAVKDASNITVGEGISQLRAYCKSFLLRLDGSVTVEAHAGSTGAGDLFYYNVAQGAFAIVPINGEAFPAIHQGLTIVQYGNITLGNNNTLAVSGIQGRNNYGSTHAIYSRIHWSGSYTPGTGTTESIGFYGHEIKPRSYHPVSSTDANVAEGEQVISPTNNNIYWKRGGIIYKAVAAAY